jgi:hypothetical protein
MSKVYKEVPYMKLVPTLSLSTAKTPSLTLNAAKNVSVYRGPEPCSVSIYMLFDPLTGEFDSIDPGILAKTLGSGNESEYELLDDREIKEVIMVCFDKSGSMSGSCFPDMISTVPIVPKRYTTSELAQLITDLKKNPRIEVFKSMYNRFPSLRSKVLAELNCIDEGFKQMEKNYIPIESSL